MAEENVQQQADVTPQEPAAQDDTYAKLASGEMSLDEMMGDKATTQEPANPAPQEPQEPVVTQEPAKPSEEETLESYKQKSQQEIERLNKIAKDNQAEFTRRSQELAAARAELASLKEQVAQLSKAQDTVEDVDLKALEDYPEDVKNLFKKLSNKNKALESQMANVDKFIRDEESQRAAESARQEQLRQIQQDFAQNILPKILEQEPDYDKFMRQNMPGYQQWAMNLSEGERFSFLNSKDPRDLVRGYREYKKFLNLPYEQEAIKQTKKENENKTGLYSTNVSNNRQVAAQAGPKKLSEQEAWELEIARQQREYDQRR